MIEAQEVLHFWFVECEPKHWFQKDEGFDREIERRFSEVHQRACACELAHWRERGEGRFAEVLILDQFSRNLYRDRPEAFAQDPLALALAQEAVAAGVDQRLEPTQRAFLYMPYMHSESLMIHDQAVRLFDQPGLENNLKFEHRHREIIERFGRYPHRNQVLARESTEEERAFLKQPGSSF